MTEIKRRQCAWCGCDMDGKGPIQEDEKEYVSHGMCHDCYKKEKKRLENKP